MPLIAMPDEAGDVTRQKVLDRVGDISGVKLFGNRVLVGVYLRGDVTARGIYLPEKHLEEDKYQGKAALVLALGPDAFVDSPNYSFNGQKVEVGDWVVLRVGESWPLALNDDKGLCRVVLDQDIAMVVPRPDKVW